MAGGGGAVDQGNEALRGQVAQNFELDESDGELGGDEGSEAAEDVESSGQEEAVDRTEDDDLLGNIEKFMRDSERADQTQPKKGQAKAPPQTQPQTRPDRYEQDQRGNIIDPKTGQVVAKAGAEARLYMDGRKAKMDAYQAGVQNQQLRGYVQQAVGFINQYKAQLDGMREANSHSERLGVTPQETMQAVEFVSRLKKGGPDAIGAIKEILTRAAAAGIDVASLGAGGSAIDVKSLVDGIRAEFAPIRQDIDAQKASVQRQREQEAQQEQQWNKAAEVTLNFFQNAPEAVPYAKVIEAGLRDPRFRGWTIREVWQHIQLHLAKNGANGSGSNESSHRSGSEPIPRGGRIPSGATYDALRPAPVNMRFEDLVNEVLDQAGYTR